MRHMADYGVFGSMIECKGIAVPRGLCVTSRRRKKLENLSITIIIGKYENRRNV